MSKQNVYDVLMERGYVAQVTDEEKVRELLGGSPLSFYTGYDPTADSLHIGHFLQMMVMAHMQRAGHRPIALMGGGTGMIGDPSGRTDLRKVLTPEDIENNIAHIKKQMELLVDFSDGKALLVNNADWILPLNFIGFLRDNGVHFSVNRMLTADAYKQRMERGLTFLEFSYMLLQAYDFYHLYQEENCILELGGSDQWSNIVAGIELIRRKTQKEAYGLTFCLLTTHDGIKMGKTAKGALWLDENKCSVYDFYQYWRNVDDVDVTRFMKLVTFMPLEEIREYEKLEGQAINEAKERLAFEVTALIHGKEKAALAVEQARSIFGSQGSAEDMPGYDLSAEDLGRPLIDILADKGFLPSRGEGRRLISQNGLKLNDQVVTDIARPLGEEDLLDGKAIVRKGKKTVIALRKPQL